MKQRALDLLTLSGKVAIVTGGASGQGRAAAELFAAHGASVVVADIDEAGARAVAESVGGLGLGVDVSQEDGVAGMIAAAEKHFGGLDILFNNAGIGYSASSRYRMANIVETPADAWDAIMAINLKSVGMGCKHAIPALLKRGGGSIINNASINAVAGVSGADAYTAAKGGIVALTRVLAVDWGARNIRTNCICPGPVATPMIAGMLQDPAFQDAMEKAVPLARVAAPEEIAAVAVFLATPAASYVNGAIISVDGGWAAR
jgi:NAD(P)-dependent dehydrogenase (short-subunit alcohol dehydrogenase family)